MNQSCRKLACSNLDYEVLVILLAELKLKIFSLIIITCVVSTGVEISQDGDKKVFIFNMFEQFHVYKTFIHFDLAIDFQ